LSGNFSGAHVYSEGGLKFSKVFLINFLAKSGNSKHSFFYQAQPKLQVQLEAELVLISFNPATHPTHPPTPHHARESLFLSLFVANPNISLVYISDT
jgi:hypothetical protein